MKHIAVALMLATTAPALAQEARLNGMAEEVIASEWADPTTLDHDYLFNPIAFDGETVYASFLLETSPLTHVLSKFGGTAHTEEIFEGTPITWACYDTGNGRTTFVSLLTGDGDDTIEPPIEPGPLVSVIIEEMNPPANPACATHADAASPSGGSEIPALGATVADLEARYGSAPIDAGGHIAYASYYEMGDEGNWLEHKVIYYRLENGLVTGVAYKLYSTR